MTATKRRRQAPRGTLTREGIVTAAFDLIAQDGLAAFSMPRLARGMGVGVTSVYWHVANKDELLDAVAERVARFVTIDEPFRSQASWDERLVAHFRHVRSVLEAHRGLGEFVAARGLPDLADVAHDSANTTQGRLEAMIGAGIPKSAAVNGYLTVSLYTLGYASWSAARAARETQGPPRRGSRPASPTDADAGFRASESDFERGLDLIIDSLRRLAAP